MDTDTDPLIPPTSRQSSRQTSNQEQRLTEPAILIGNTRPEWKTKLSFCLVLLTETLERTAFYGILCNMVLFLNANPMFWASYNAVNSIFVLNGISYVFAIFGGWLADACLGKFRSIVLFFVIYIVGFSFWPFFYPYPSRDTSKHSVPEWCTIERNDSARYLAGMLGVSRTVNDWAVRDVYLGVPATDVPPVPWWRESCVWAVYLSIAVIAIGYGSVRANIIPFGAHQVRWMCISVCICY